MKIKLAILDRDARYLNRIEKAFGSKYEDKFEIYSFTDMQAALNTLEPARIEVLLSSDSFEIDTELLPKRCGFAYLVEAQDVVTFRDERAICKFQKADLFYKQILMVYSENAERMGFRMAGDGSRIILFTGAGGGVGASTMAAACALHFADQKKKVLYLNLEQFGTADLFFDGDGQFDMSDVIFALKSKRPNLSIKLEGSVRQDPREVYFYAGSKIALDKMELNAEDVHNLLAALARSGYDYIIVDADFSLDQESLKIYREAHAIVLVGNGTESSNVKTERALVALRTKEHNADVPLINRISFLYNKVSSKGSKEIQLDQIRILGGTPVYAASSTEQLLDQLRHLDAFNKIL